MIDLNKPSPEDIRLAERSKILSSLIDPDILKSFTIEEACALQMLRNSRSKPVLAADVAPKAQSGKKGR